LSAPSTQVTALPPSQIVPSASSTTATGLPLNGTAVNTSTR
jgi:hypothetical protein